MPRCRRACWQRRPRPFASLRRWLIPLCPMRPAKVWRQLGQGELADAAKKGFLTDLAWGGLKAGTKFGEPAPLFPRAEKDAVERMQNLEDENSKSAVEVTAPGRDCSPGDRARSGLCIDHHDDKQDRCSRQCRGHAHCGGAGRIRATRRDCAGAPGSGATGQQPIELHTGACAG